MSRGYQNAPEANTRRPLATRPQMRPPYPPPTTHSTFGARAPTVVRATRPQLRPPYPPPTTHSTFGARAPTGGRAIRAQPPRQERNDQNSSNEDNRTRQQERTMQTGDGYHMIPPSIQKNQQIRRQAENEQREYEAHVERTRLHHIHEVHRLGGDGLSQEEARRRQAEKYRQDKYVRLEKAHQDQIQRKEEEERDLKTKKQAAREQSMENEKRDNQLCSMRPTRHQSDQGATGRTDETHHQPIDRSLNGLSRQYDDMTLSSDDHRTTNSDNRSKAEKLSALRDAFSSVDTQTLEDYLEFYNGDLDQTVDELLNQM